MMSRNMLWFVLDNADFRGAPSFPRSTRLKRPEASQPRAALTLLQDISGAHHNKTSHAAIRGRCVPFGGRAWKEGLHRLKAEPSKRAPGRARKPGVSLSRGSIFHATSRCRAWT